MKITRYNKYCKICRICNMIHDTMSLGGALVPRGSASPRQALGNETLRSVIVSNEHRSSVIVSDFFARFSGKRLNKIEFGSQRNSVAWQPRILNASDFSFLPHTVHQLPVIVIDISKRRSSMVTRKKSGKKYNKYQCSKKRGPRISRLLRTMFTMFY